jgi:hypothetical protein
VTDLLQATEKEGNIMFFIEKFSTLQHLRSTWLMMPAVILATVIVPAGITQAEEESEKPTIKTNFESLALTGVGVTQTQAQTEEKSEEPTLLVSFELSSSTGGGAETGFNLGSVTNGSFKPISGGFNQPINNVPEMDITAAPGAIALLLGFLALIRERSRRFP